MKLGYLLAVIGMSVTILYVELMRQARRVVPLRNVEIGPVIAPDGRRTLTGALSPRSTLSDITNFFNGAAVTWDHLPPPESYRNRMPADEEGRTAPDYLFFLILL